MNMHTMWITKYKLKKYELLIDGSIRLSFTYIMRRYKRIQKNGTLTTFT